MSLNHKCQQCGTIHSRLDVRCPGCGKQGLDDVRPEGLPVNRVTPDPTPWLTQLREAKKETLEEQIPPEKRDLYGLTRGLLRAMQDWE